MASLNAQQFEYMGEKSPPNKLPTDSYRPSAADYELKAYRNQPASAPHIGPKKESSYPVHVLRKK